MIAAGSAALSSLRIEKGYRMWGTDMTPEHTPAEAGLGFAVRTDDSDFLGRDGLAARAPATRRLATLTLEPDVVMTGGEPLFVDGQVAGYVTSAAYGPSVGARSPTRGCRPSSRPATPWWCDRLGSGGPGDGRTRRRAVRSGGRTPPRIMIRPDRWALEAVTNPSVLRLPSLGSAHRSHDRVVPSGDCAGAAGSAALDPRRALAGLLHRYRVRLNLGPDGFAGQATVPATETLTEAWGTDAFLDADEGPRAFQVAREGDRQVAESLEMAEGHGDAMLMALFAVEGVAEAIAGKGLVLVRLGRLFRWDECSDAVVAALNA